MKSKSDNEKETKKTSSPKTTKATPKAASKPKKEEEDEDDEDEEETPRKSAASKNQISRPQNQKRNLTMTRMTWMTKMMIWVTTMMMIIGENLKMRITILTSRSLTCLKLRANVAVLERKV